MHFFTSCTRQGWFKGSSILERNKISALWVFESQSSDKGSYGCDHTRSLGQLHWDSWLHWKGPTRLPHLPPETKLQWKLTFQVLCAQNTHQRMLLLRFWGVFLSIWTGLEWGITSLYGYVLMHTGFFFKKNENKLGKHIPVPLCSVCSSPRLLNLDLLEAAPECTWDCCVITAELFFLFNSQLYLLHSQTPSPNFHLLTLH